MKRFFLLFLAVSLFLSACGSDQNRNKANEIFRIVRENSSLIALCAEEMKNFEAERIYVAIEDNKDTEEHDPRLVSYEKESGDRSEIENETLEKALKDLGLKLIFFQTAADARRCVIFSFQKESFEGIAYGFYYSFDLLPCGWWGREAKLKKKDGRFLQIDRNGNAWYQTVQIEDNFYYFEKHGNLVA